MKCHPDPKRPPKRPANNNRRLLTCLPITRKIVTAQMREKIYYSLKSKLLFSEERKECHKGKRGTRDFLYIDQHTLKDSKTRRKHVTMAWTDKKCLLYDPTKLDNSLKIYTISDKVTKFISQAMKSWRVDMIIGGKT